MSWFRVHTSMLHHAVVQGLPGETFKAWLNILCLAKDGDGVIPNVKEIAFQLRKGLSFAQRVTDELVNDYGLLERNEDGTFHARNWERHQYKSDNVTERVRAFRERQRNVSETPPEYRVQSTESDTEQKQSIAPPKPGSAATHGSRFAEETLPERWLLWSVSEFAWSAGQSAAVFEKFADYWRAVPGQKGRKADWMGTWRNWCRKEDADLKAAMSRNGKQNGRLSFEDGVAQEFAKRQRDGLL